MKFLVAFAMVAAVAAIPVEFRPDQVVFVNEALSNNILPRIDIGPAFVEYNPVFVVENADSQLLNENIEVDLPKFSPVLVVDIADVSNFAEPAEAVQVVDLAQPAVAIDAVQVIDVAEESNTVQFVDAAEPDVAVDAVQVVDAAEPAVNVESVKAAEDAPSPVEISEAILPEIVQPVIVAE